jgi:tRNA (Thr-GGU) A37 N-methylase
MFATQLNFSDEITNQIQVNLQACGETFEEFVQQAVAHELQRRKANDLKSFFDGLQPLESFSHVDALAYVDDSRRKSRLFN